MNLSGKEYVIARRKKAERRQKIVTIISVVSFFGSTAFAAVSALKKAIYDPKPVTVSAESVLQQKARGFEFVLEREPENQVALEGLAMVRLHLKDTQDAIPPLAKLVKLHPERQDYKVVLEQARKQVGKGEGQTNNQQKPN